MKISSGSEDKREITDSREMDPIEKVKHTLAYCFNDVFFAESYVDAIISLAIEELTPKPKTTKSYAIVSPIVDEIVAAVFQTIAATHGDICPEVVQTHFSGWPKVSDFNIKLGLEKLEEYISSWQTSEDWMSCVEFIGFESEESSNYFVYEVEFTVPTPMYPIPQVTASVYFSLEVSKIIPPPYDAPVQVTYVFESSNVIHVPGRIDFQETWIKDLIRNGIKSLLFKVKQ